MWPNSKFYIGNRNPHGSISTCYFVRHQRSVPTKAAPGVWTQARLANVCMQWSARKSHNEPRVCCQHHSQKELCPLHLWAPSQTAFERSRLSQVQGPDRSHSTPSQRQQPDQHRWKENTVIRAHLIQPPSHAHMIPWFQDDASITNSPRITKTDTIHSPTGVQACLIQLTFVIVDLQACCECVGHGLEV